MREPARDLRVPAPAARTRRRRDSRTACCWPRPTSGPRTPSRYMGQRRHVPHGVPLPAHAAHVHGGPAGGPLPDRRHPGGDPAHPSRLPVGALPPQPRRAHARDGHRRGARLHVPGLRAGSPGAGQRGHPPAAGPAAGQRPQADRDDERARSSPCRARRSSTTATRSAWATTSTSATATRCGRRCNGTATATPASPTANPQRLYLPVIIDPEYHSQAVNVEAQAQNPNSLLWWMKRLIALRQRYKAFGRGTLEILLPGQPQGLRLHPPLRGGAHPRASSTCRGTPSARSSTCPRSGAPSRSSSSGNAGVPAHR